MTRAIFTVAIVLLAMAAVLPPVEPETGPETAIEAEHRIAREEWLKPVVIDDSYIGDSYIVEDMPRLMFQCLCMDGWHSVLPKFKADCCSGPLRGGE